MITIELKEVFRAKPQVIWEYLTNLENQNWRKNITYIETNPDGSEFVEHTGDEGDMSYKVVASQPGQIYEVNFENENIQGMWHGELSETEDGGTVLHVSVSVEAKRAVYKPYLKAYVTKQAKDHLMYLKEVLGETSQLDDGRFSGFNNISLAIVLGLIIGGITRSIAIGIGAGIITLIALYFIKKR